MAFGILGLLMWVSPMSKEEKQIIIEPDKCVTISECGKLLVSLDDVKAGTPIIKPRFPQLQHECKECQSQVHPKEQ